MFRALLGAIMVMFSVYALDGMGVVSVGNSTITTGLARSEADVTTSAQALTGERFTDRIVRKSFERERTRTVTQ